MLKERLNKQEIAYIYIYIYIMHTHKMCIKMQKECRNLQTKSNKYAFVTANLQKLCRNMQEVCLKCAFDAVIYK